MEGTEQTNYCKYPFVDRALTGITDDSTCAAAREISYASPLPNKARIRPSAVRSLPGAGGFGAEDSNARKSSNKGRRTIRRRWVIHLISGWNSYAGADVNSCRGCAKRRVRRGARGPSHSEG